MTVHILINLLIIGTDESRRSTDSGNQLDCYFCKKCGSRIIHSTPGKDIVSIKGGCIEGLDWTDAIHIWCKRAGEFFYNANRNPPD